MSNDCLDVALDINSGDAQRRQAARLKPNVSSSIPFQSIITTVRLAIDFDDEQCLVAIKVGDIRPRRMLPPKFKAARTVA